jgi:FMN phosphatase YigB (HAD superfamily)
LERRRQRRAAIAQGFFAAAGKPIEAAPIRRALAATVSKISALRMREHACPGHAEVGSMIAAEVGFRLSFDDAKLLAEAISSMGRDEPPAPADGAGVLLSQLRGKVKLAIISDTGLTFGMHLQQAMETHGLAEFFECFTWSDTTLTTKPSSRQFLHTLHRLNVTPAEAVHVGDLEAADIAGAREVGMRAIRIGDDEAESAADAGVTSLVQVGDVLRQWGMDL